MSTCYRSQPNISSSNWRKPARNHVGHFYNQASHQMLCGCIVLCSAVVTLMAGSTTGNLDNVREETTLTMSVAKDSSHGSYKTSSAEAPKKKNACGTYSTSAAKIPTEQQCTRHLTAVPLSTAPTKQQQQRHLGNIIGGGPTK